MIPRGRARTCWPGTGRCSAGWGAVPRALVWDNESAVGSWRGGRPQLTEAMTGVPRRAGDQGDPVPPAGSGGQGPGRAGQRVPGDLVPARTRGSPPRPTSTPSSAVWLARANQRQHRRLGLPPGRPLGGRPGRDGGAAAGGAGGSAWADQQLRLPRDHYVRLDANDYSVHPRAVGRRVDGQRRPRARVPRSPATRPVAGSRVTTAAGRGTRPSPTPSTPRPPRRCAKPASDQPAADRSHDEVAAPRPGRLRPRLRPRRRRRSTRRRGRLMATKTNRDRRRRRRNVASELAFLTRALKAPSLAAAVERLAERARPRAGPTRSSWPPACNARSPPAKPTAARAASAPPGSRPAKRWRTSTSTTNAPSSARSSPTSAPWTSSPRKENVVFLGPPGTGKTHLAIGLGDPRLPGRAPHRVRHRRRVGRPPRRGPPRRPAAGRADQARPGPAADHRRGRLHPVRSRSREPVLPTRLVPLRTGQPDRHQQQALRPLGRGLRRRRRRRRHDRPPRPPRRGRLPQGRQLPTQGPRPRPRPRQPPRPTTRPINNHRGGPLSAVARGSRFSRR